MSKYAEFYAGRRLYGDDFTADQIQEWFEDEQTGYFNLTASADKDPQQAYQYDALNISHGYRHLEGMRFERCLGIGVGSGRDLMPVADQVGEFYCVEPGRDWWTNELFGKPAQFVSPHADGYIDVADGSFDLAVSFGVLHHIPNVTAVLAQIHRTLKPGGIFVLREPIVTMGEWGQPRQGLTKNERGLPLAWLRQTMQETGFTTVNEQLCDFRPFYFAATRLTGKAVFADPLLTRIDAALSSVTAFNVRYHRPTLLDKFAPASVLGVYQKDPV